MKTKAIAVPVALLAIASGWGLGCGGSSSATTETTARLAKAQFLDKGNQICRKRLEEKDAAVKAAVKEVVASGKKDASKQLREEVGERILAIYREILQEFSDLQPPAAREASVKNMRSQLRTALEKAKADPSSVFTTNYFEDAAKDARTSGFTTCSF